MARVIAFDCETALFRPSEMAPPVTCVSYHEYGCEAQLVSVHDAKPLVYSWLTSDVVLVGQNVAFDVCCLMEEFPEHIPLWFEKYERDQVTDTMLRAELIDIANGTHGDKSYSLAALYQLCTGRVLTKPQTRYEYGPLRDVPIADWTPEQRRYALDDAKATLDVAVAQGKQRHLLGDQYFQCRAYLALQLCSAWGIRTDAAAVAALEQLTRTRRNSLSGALTAGGILRRDGSKNMAGLRSFVQRVSQEKGVDLQLTPKGELKTAKDVLADLKDPLANVMVEWAELGSVLNREVPLLESGTTWPIHSRFGLADSGRTTSSPNVQNVSPEVRPCFVPRPGYLYAQADYDQFELRGHAQVNLEWFGESKMQDLLMSGMCPHIWFGSKVWGWDPDDATVRYNQGDPEVKNARQTAKACLFGFPGGMGIPKFVAQVRKRGLILTETKAWELKNMWLFAFPEMPKYFRKIREFEQFDGTYTVKQLYSGRIRGGMGYTDACNTPFQGICADAAKQAVWEIQKACYADRKNVLYGSRLVNFIHDENIIEIPDDVLAHERAMELGRLMVSAARKFIKDVEVKATPCLMKRWTKGAKPLYSKEGRLIPV
jgi:hypothetical protein